MKLFGTYAQDEKTSVWRRENSHEFAYTDGDAIEQRIKRIIDECADPSVFSTELERSIIDWPSLYHLGRGRLNLLWPFKPELAGNILEIGCGCGAITRALGELGGNVLALEGSQVRAEIAASRCRGLPNVSIVNDSFDTFEPDQRFDVVTLIGVLEYARKYFKTSEGGDAVQEMLAKARSFLRPGGVLLLAIENQLGLKYLAGSPEDHNGIPMYGIEDLYGVNEAVTYGEDELRRLLNQAGLGEQQWWYPFPDYKFPVSMLSEHGVHSRAGDLSPLLQNSVLTDPQRAPTSFSLENAWAPVLRNGLAGALANSFAVMASDQPQQPNQEKVLAYHFASGRREAFAKKVAFCENEAGQLIVKHQPLFDAAGAALPDELSIGFEDAAFIPGRHWQAELIQIVNRPGWTLDSLYAWGERWFSEFLLHAGLRDRSVLNKSFNLEGRHIDAVPRNLIIGPDGAGVFFDQEWLLSEPCPLGFLIFRSLGLSFFGLTSVAKPADGVSIRIADLFLALAEHIGIAVGAGDFADFVRRENALQELVTNKSAGNFTLELFAGSNLDVRLPFWHPEVIARLESAVYNKDRDLGQLGEEVHRLETTVVDKDLHLGQLGEEVHRLEEVIQNKAQELNRLGDEVRRLEVTIIAKDQGLVHLGQEVRRLEALIADKEQGLAYLSSELHRIEAAILSKDSGLEYLGKEVQRLEAVILDKDRGLAHLGEEVHRLEAMISEKDAGLAQLGTELNALHAQIPAHTLALAQQADEIHRLETVIADKDQGLAGLANEVRRLEIHAEAKQAEVNSLVLLLQEAEGAMNELQQVRQQQASTIETLTTELWEKESLMQKQGNDLQAKIDGLTADLARAIESFEAERHYYYAEVAKRDNELAQTATQLAVLRAEFQAVATDLSALRQTRWVRLREVLLFHPFGWRKLTGVARIVAGGLIPRSLRARSAPPAAPKPGTTDDTGAYHVKLPAAPPHDAPRIVHVIANFMTGGSSRLVVDLVEYLGNQYHHHVFTSFAPNPPAYIGLDIEECRHRESTEPFVDYFKRVQPDAVHVHYWGDCDEPWYAQAIEAARMLGLPVIENINTPIAPYRSEAVAKYVYVSDYVRSVFGEADARHVTVYPGSDFNLFTRSRKEHAPEDCVGMVYRLEHDKLNEAAIQPFIRIAQLRPSTKILIVGGGSLLDPFKAAVTAAGVAANFEFTGYVSYDVLPDLYRRMSIFVAPVWKESFGQVSPFAMSMKVPVIGYDIGAIPEIIGTKDLVAPGGDADALARIAVRLLDSPKERKALGETQQQRAQGNFSVQAMIDHYAQIYAEITHKVSKESA